MASTFKRHVKPPSADTAPATASSSTASSNMLGLRGTKPWTGGTTLTSSGLRDLDNILGGGQPLGTCLLIEEDRWTQSLASSLLRYWCAEGVSQSQRIIIPTFESDRSIDDTFDEESRSLGPTKAEMLHFLASLPRNLHWDKRQQQESKQEHGDKVTMMETLEEDDENRADDDSEKANTEDGLKIAWQYRKDVQRQRLGHDLSSVSASRSSEVFCHSFDLSGRLSDQLKSFGKEPLESTAVLKPLRCCADATHCKLNRSCGFRLFSNIWHQLQTLLNQQPRNVVRLLLHHIHPDILCVALPLLLAQIRLQQSPVVVLVCLRPWKHDLLSVKSTISLHRASDVVLQTEGFAARSLFPPPPEFRHLHGLLLIRKVSTVTAATAIGGGHYADLTMSKRPPANIYGLKRDRRKLHIPLLHIPPEDHAQGGGSVGGGGVRSGAGRSTKPSSVSTSASSCGSGGHNSALDF